MWREQDVTQVTAETHRGSEGGTHQGSGWRFGQAGGRGAAGWSRTVWPGRALGS